MENGAEISVPASIPPHSKVYLSAGEPFVSPALISSTTESATAPAQLDVPPPDADAVAAPAGQPVTPPSGPLETVATTAASLLCAGYSMASHFVKKMHPPTGQRLENVEQAVRENLGGYAVQGAPAVRGGLRWADRQVSCALTNVSWFLGASSETWWDSNSRINVESLEPAHWHSHIYHPLPSTFHSYPASSRPSANRRTHTLLPNKASASRQRSTRRKPRSQSLSPKLQLVWV